MGLRQIFGTDKAMESDGIFLEYHNVRVRVRRINGSDKTYAKCMAKLIEPHQARIDAGVMSDDESTEIFYQCMAEAGVIEVQAMKDGQWVRGLYASDLDPETDSEEIAPDTVENRKALFYAMPDLYRDIAEQTRKIRLFKEEGRRVSEGN